ncbi:MAG: T9SS type A sorting domain-containing protein [Tannerellaceae bacterium]|nr:T9SS type A sorting domain-containing protein [Tannerellaceae bacterium]
MKKTIHIGIIALFISLIFGITEAKSQINVYVSHTTSAKGNGTQASPYNLSELFEKVIKKKPAGDTVNIFFEKGGVYYTGYFANTSDYGLTSSGWDGKTVTFDVWGNGSPVIFDGSKHTNVFVNINRGRPDNAKFALNVKNIIFQNFNNNSASPFVAVTSWNNSLNMDNVTVRNCNNILGNLFQINNSTSEFTLSNSSIINNERGTNRLIYLQSLKSAYIYNNTFSGNTSAYVIELVANNTYFFNNTVYNSGALYINTYLPQKRIINNLVTGSSTISFGGTTPEYRVGLKNNVSGTTYWKTGSTLSSSFTKDQFANCFDTILVDNNSPGGQFHKLENTSDPNHLFLEKGLTVSDLKKDVAINQDKDQSGNERSARYPISLGAIDYWNVALAHSPVITVLFHSNEGAKLPLPKEIDLKEFVLETPAGVDISQLDFELLNTSMKYGTLSKLTTDKKTTFTPATPGGKPVGVNVTDTFSYKVSRKINGVLYEKTGIVKVIIVDKNEPVGYIDPVDHPNTCFDFMGKIAFSGDYRFITGQSYNLVAFSIPLVADLNKDGYPEIIAMGKKGSSWDYHYESVRIFNGQTGKLISSLQIASDNFVHDGWHSSPSSAVLVDANRDGVVELIMAFPQGGGGDKSEYRGKVVSFNLRPADSVYVLEHNRTFPVGYGDGITSKASLPTPQVCDLDGDGTPELLVYNKVYDAVSGELLFTIDQNYMGRNPLARYDNDRYQVFPYIYDLDGDGIYDIAAGGKMYRITKPGGAWKVQEIELNSSDNPGDGFTGVADIDGDGLPDIVTVRAVSVEDNGPVLVTVWNPGFANGVANPRVIAKKTVKYISRGGLGSNSYVYIGDINGVEYGGKRLPEITVLSGRVEFTDKEVHPGVSGLKGQTTNGDGVIFALTFDGKETDITKKLKFSFFLEHNDDSVDTGFTMFDFDNDGIMEICYRDRKSLRIIKPTKSYVALDESSTDIILFNKTVYSGTGFEYPVIADIDNDASAEMLVMGYPENGRYHGNVYALGNTGDKFAPARPVWNQFIYDPFKINDDLTTPVGPAKNRLAYKYQHDVKNDEGIVEKTINNYQPYNATINQTPYFTTLSNGAGKINSFEPIVFLTESYLVTEKAKDEAKRPKIVMQGGKAFIEVTIGNKATAKTDISVNAPIAIYENQISPSTFVKKESLSNLGVTTVIKAGQEIRVRIPVANAYSVYHVRLGDDSGYDDKGKTNWKWHFGTNNEGQGAGTNVSNPPADPAGGIGKARRAYRDCNWTDQAVKVSLINLNHDAVTVQEFKSVMIDVFANDVINISDPSNPFPALKPDFKMSNQYIRGKGPVAGTLTFSGSNIIYTHNGTIPPGNIDTFSYAFNYALTGSGVKREFSANVYIYIMQPVSGSFGVCHGDDFSVKLKESPKDIRFIWWNEQNQLQTSSDSLTIRFGAITAPKTYTVKPLLTTWNNDRIEFVPGQLTVSPLGNPGRQAVMKWTGVIDTNWNDPRNWVEIKGSVETSASIAPASCTDIIIPSGLKNYPILTRPASCANITMKNNAMIAGIHWLTYTNAQVELKLNPADRNRFIMWSAPLMNMYSGDYHFKKGNAPYWGDVFVNFFQSKNPDDLSSVAKDNHFTATFKNLGVELGQGQAFNLKLLATSLNKDSIFVFPKTEKSYTATDGALYHTPRNAHAGKFMSDTVIAAGNRIRVPSAMSSSNYIQVANPFMAYLDIKSFLANNTNLENSVKIWNGGTNTQPNAAPGDFITILPYKASGNRYIIDNADSWFGSGTNHTGYIAPLQSFFVKKANPGETISVLNMNPAWTTTLNPSPLRNYTLRADTAEVHTLRIKAMQNREQSVTVLFFHPKASPDYNKDDDAYKLFSSETAVSVYSFSPANDPLAIQASNNFQHAAIRLGIRLKEAGKVSLHFSGMETFGYKVYLIDHLQNNKKTDVQQNPTYTFTAVKQSPNDKVIELNDRFTLEMQYTGYIETANETVQANKAIITSKDGCIYVQTPSVARSLEVYNMAGALVYSSHVKSDNYQAYLDSPQTYIVKVTINDEYIIEKIFVR